MIDSAEKENGKSSLAIINCKANTTNNGGESSAASDFYGLSNNREPGVHDNEIAAI